MFKDRRGQRQYVCLQEGANDGNDKLVEGGKGDFYERKMLLSDLEKKRKKLMVKERGRSRSFSSTQGSATSTILKREE